MLKKQYHWGYLAIVATVLVTLLLWIGSRFYYQEFYDDQFKYVAKIGSMSATILMCWAFILSTRFAIVEQLFGGLDKAYKAHQRVGKASFFLIFLHPIFLAMHRMPDVGHYLEYFWFSGDWLRNSGIIALWLLVALVVLSLWVSLPYHRWKVTHNFFGLVLLVVIAHIILADADVSRYLPLKIWFVGWLGLAVLCYIYIRVLYRYFGPYYEYQVVENYEHGQTLEIHLRPVCRALRHRPAQFAYVLFETPGLRPEPHPFTISSPPQSANLRFSVKELGDWTSKLSGLKPGVRAWIWGPYGKFSRYLYKHPELESVFIAGGIGITPFLSILEDDEFLHKKRGKTYLFYSVLNKDEAYYHDEIRSLHLQEDKVTYFASYSDEEGYLTADIIAGQANGLEEKSFFICGPKPMMDSLREQLLEAGVPFERIYTEDFSLI